MAGTAGASRRAPCGRVKAQFAIIRRTALSKAGLTSVLLRRWRFRFCVFLVRIWFFSACRRRTLPLPVRWKRFAAPRWVLSFGTIRLSDGATRLPLRCGLIHRAQDAPSGGRVRAHPCTIMHDRPSWGLDPESGLAATGSPRPDWDQPLRLARWDQPIETLLASRIFTRLEGEATLGVGNRVRKLD